MAVTLNTIPTQTGEVVRALITSGLGGDNTVNRIWLDTRTATASGSFVGDLEVASTLPGSVTRLIWHTTGQFRLIFVSGGILAAAADGGALFGKHILLAFNDTDPPIDVELGIADATDTLDKQLRFNATAAEETLYDAVALGSLINFVISDMPGGRHGGIRRYGCRRSRPERPRSRRLQTRNYPHRRSTPGLSVSRLVLQRWQRARKRSGWFRSSTIPL